MGGAVNPGLSAPLGVAVSCALAFVLLEGALRCSRASIAGPAPQPPPDWFVTLVVRRGASVPPSVLWERTVSVAPVVAVVLVLTSLPVALALVVAAGAGLVVSRGVAARGASTAYAHDLVGVADAVAASLAAGVAPEGALDTVGRGTAVGRDLAAVVARHRQGSPLQTELDHWAQANPQSGARLLADALALASQTGGSRAQAAAGVARTLREREALTREIRALGAQVRASALVMVAAPAAFAAVSAAADRRVAAFLLGQPAGWACVLGGLALDGAGAWWIHRLGAGLR